MEKEEVKLNPLTGDQVELIKDGNMLKLEGYLSSLEGSQAEDSIERGDLKSPNWGGNHTTHSNKL